MTPDTRKRLLEVEEYGVHFSFERRACLICRFKSVMAWRVLQPLRKSYWQGERMSFDSRNQNNLLLCIC